MTPLKVFVPASEAAPRFDSALDAVPAPVPPWETDNGVSKADNAVMSELAPLAAAPSVARAPEGVPAPVPPRASGTTPLPRLPAFKPTNAEPSPLKLPANRLAGWVKRLTPLKVLVPVREAALRFTRALAAVLAPLPPCEIESGVLRPDNEVMSELAPLAAAPRVARAPGAVPAPVPPRPTDTTPLARLAALTPVSPEPSPLKLPINRLAG